MASNIDELTKDLEEFHLLLTHATRVQSQKILKNEIKRIETEIEHSKKPSPSSTVAASASSTPVLPTVTITTYAWDQSEKFLKLYVTVPGASPGQENQVKFEVKSKSVEFQATDIAGKNYVFSMKGLLYPISTDDSEFKVKNGQILLMLKKQDAGKTWAYVTETEMIQKEKNKPKMDNNDDPNAGMMAMMKQMYDDGDDEMKRTIKKAMFEAQEKKKQGGAGDPMAEMMGGF